MAKLCVFSLINSTWMYDSLPHHLPFDFDPKIHLWVVLLGRKVHNQFQQAIKEVVHDNTCNIHVGSALQDYNDLHDAVAIS